MQHRADSFVQVGPWFMKEQHSLLSCLLRLQHSTTKLPGKREVLQLQHAWIWQTFPCFKDQTRKNTFKLCSQSCFWSIQIESTVNRLKKKTLQNVLPVLEMVSQNHRIVGYARNSTLRSWNELSKTKYERGSQVQSLQTGSVLLVLKLLLPVELEWGGVWLLRGEMGWETEPPQADGAVAHGNQDFCPPSKHKRTDHSQNSTVSMSWKRVLIASLMRNKVKYFRVQ